MLQAVDLQIMAPRPHINKSVKRLESCQEKRLAKRVIRDSQANATKQRILRQIKNIAFQVYEMNMPEVERNISLVHCNE